MILRRDAVPGLRAGVSYVYDHVRDQRALLYPEGVLLLNDSAAATVERCDGTRSVAQVADDLETMFDGVHGGEVRELLGSLQARGLMTFGGGRPVPAPRVIAGTGDRKRDPVPMGLIAELTYRCPLQCFYCSNPINLDAYRDELSTHDWRRVLSEARALGVLQLHLTGGEPLLRRDLAELIGHARSLEMYVNLVSSGIPSSARRLEELIDAGLNHFQLSVQDSDEQSADAIAGVRASTRKREVAAELRRLGVPLTVNAVLHRRNVDHVEAIADLAAALGAERLELAHTQYYGWALRNRAALLPDRDQVERAADAAEQVSAKYRDRMRVVHVRSDYHSETPKPCMNGWGMRQFAIAPNGAVLPCLAAGQLPDMEIPNVRLSALDAIWYASAAFTRFRGTDWMPEPCHSCALREIDFGGCRCQAYQLTGDATATDPACSLSPHHDLMARFVADDHSIAPVPRRMSRRR